LLEKSYAQKDRTKRKECRINAFEYCLVANAIDGSNASALIHLANHIFFTWKLISTNARFIGSNEIKIPFFNGQLTTKDPVQINGLVKVFLEDIRLDATDNSAVLVLNGDTFAKDFPGNLHIEVKEYGEVLKLAGKVFYSRSQQVPIEYTDELVAESAYILARTYHARNQVKLAIQYYEKSFELNPEPLAAFALGQLYLSKEDFSKSYEKFEFVQSKHPDDKDTQAYLIFIRSVSRAEISGFEKLREVAQGFPFEVLLHSI